MKDIEMIEALRNYAKSYSNGNPYSFNPGVAIMVANRIEQFVDKQTKFNIGDTVWIPDLYYNWYPSKNEYKIINIKVQINSNDQRIFYTVKDIDGYTHEYPESMCFSSYDECKQWCDKSN